MIIHMVSDQPLPETFIQVLRNVRNEDYPMIMGFEELEIECEDDEVLDVHGPSGDLDNLLVLGKAPDWVKDNVWPHAYAPSVKETIWSAGGITKLRYALSRLVNGLESAGYAPDDYQLVDPATEPGDLSAFQDLSRYHWTKDDTLFVDIEVSGDISIDSPETTELLSVAVRCIDMTWVWTYEALQDADLLMLLTDWLHRATIILHNGFFDCRWLNHHLNTSMGKLYPDQDTILMHHSQFLGAGEHGLKPLCQRIFGAPEWEAEAKEYTRADAKMGYAAGNHYERIPKHLLYRYNAGDVYWTQQLFFYLRQLLEMNPEAQKAYAHEMADGRLCMDVTDRGMPVDVPYGESLNKQLADELETILTNLQESVAQGLYGKSVQEMAEICALQGKAKKYQYVPFNPSSPKQVIDYFTKRGYEIASSNEATLMGLWQKGCEREVIDGILDYRGTRVARSVFVEGVLKKVHNDRVHPSYKVHGTSTSRLSSSGPNIQNVSNDVEGKPSMRRMYRTLTPAEVFIGCDYAQAELRVMAELSDDPDMIAALQADSPDFFTAMLPKVFPHDNIAGMSDKERKPLRLKLKRVVYGSSYGLQPKSIAYALTIAGTPTSPAEAQAIQDGYLGIYPGLRAWRDNTMDELQANGLLTPFGHRMQMELITRESYNRIRNQAWAFKPQGIASNICQLAAMKFQYTILPKIDKTAGIVAMVHDAIYVEGRVEAAEEIKSELEQTMQWAGAEIYSRVPFLTDGHIAREWNNA